MADKPNLENYIEVHERIAAFYKDHPDGRLRCKRWYFKTVDEATFIIYEALAYRDPKDELPGEGMAMEPFPGKTPYTKDSELMNAETSAWGRALASLGYEIHRGIATKQDVQARSGGNGVPIGFASQKQRDFFKRLLGDVAGVSNATAELVTSFAAANLEGNRDGPISKSIDALKEKATAKDEATRLKDLATAWEAEQSDVSADTDGLPEADAEAQTTL